MKRTIVNGVRARATNVIVAMKNSQHAPFQGRHDYRLTTACTDETQRNIWGRAHGRLSHHSHPIRQMPFACDTAVVCIYVGYNFNVQGSVHRKLYIQVYY